MSSTNPAPISAADEIDDAFIGRRVHQVMWDQRVTQTTLGSALGMDQSTVGKRLRGVVGWPAPLLVKTARFLDTTVAYLVGEADEPTTPTTPNPETADYSSVASLDDYRREKVTAHTATHSDHDATITPIRKAAGQ